MKNYITLTPSYCKYFSILIFSILYLNANYSYAATGTASTGDWSLSSTWTIGGVNRTPACGDTLMIPASVTVTLSSQENYYYCTDGILILVAGTFQLSDGFKLR